MIVKKMKVGIFDSGVGGKSVANSVSSAFPDLEILYLQDKDNLPYGDKSKDELIELTTPFIEKFKSENCDVILIACNTITTNIIEDIRSTTTIPVIGIEPMVKPAAKLTKSKIIAVCATPATLQSNRYKQLIDDYASGIKIIEPDCSKWASMIESSDNSKHLIHEQIIDVCKKGVDVIVLGCTHYHWIEDEICKITEYYNVSVIQPEQAIITRLTEVLKQLA